MKQILKIGMMLLLPGLISAQGDVINTGAKIKLSSGAHINVNGNVENNAGGQITNSGTIHLSEDWTMTGASTYSGVGVVAFENGTSQNITTPSGITFWNLKVDNGDKVILNCNTGVSGNLDLTNGKIEAGNYNLNLGSGATVSNASANNYVVTNGTGGVRRLVAASNTMFPVGLSNYNPVTINNSGTLDNFKVRVEDGLYENYPGTVAETYGVVNRAWFVEEDVAGGSNASVTVQWNTWEELASFDRTQSGVAQYTGSAWSHAGTYGAATSVSGAWSQTRTGITTFGAQLPFAVEDSRELVAVDDIDGGAGTNVLLMPNPTSDYINLKFDLLQSTDAFINIYAADGKLIYSREMNVEDQQVITIEESKDFAPGTYLLQAILDNGAQVTKRFVKNRY